MMARYMEEEIQAIDYTTCLKRNKVRVNKNNTHLYNTFVKINLLIKCK